MPRILHRSSRTHGAGTTNSARRRSSSSRNSTSESKSMVAAAAAAVLQTPWASSQGDSMDGSARSRRRENDDATPSNSSSTTASATFPRDFSSHMMARGTVAVHPFPKIQENAYRDTSMPLGGGCGDAWGHFVDLAQEDDALERHLERRNPVLVSYQRRG